MRYRRYIPVIAAVWCAVYVVAHLWWAVAGEPAFFGRAASFFPGGWLPIVLAAAASAGSFLAARKDGPAWPPAASWMSIGLAGLGGVGMIVYCMLVWIGLVMVLMVPFGLPMSSTDVGLLIVRAAGTIGGGLALWAARSEFLRLRPACDHCGDVHELAARSRTARTPWWGFAGGYLAVVGLSVRVLPQARDVLDVWSSAGGGFHLFVVLMLVAGTVLPLALVHRWGRVWPHWVVPWAGREVPRLLVLGPAVLMGTGLVAYFGAGGTSAMVTGATPADLKAILEIGGYTVWGIGLLLAATAYARLTGPSCPPVEHPRTATS